MFGDSEVDIAPEQKAVRPITAPYFHEDAFVATDLRAWSLNHDFDSDTAGVLNKGSVEVMALRVRVALTESLQFVAYKDSYTSCDDAGALDDNSGWNDIGGGLNERLSKTGRTGSMSPRVSVMNSGLVTTTCCRIPTSFVYGSPWTKALISFT